MPTCRSATRAFAHPSTYAVTRRSPPRASRPATRPMAGPLWSAALWRRRWVVAEMLAPREPGVVERAQDDHHMLARRGLRPDRRRQEARGHSAELSTWMAWPVPARVCASRSSSCLRMAVDLLRIDGVWRARRNDATRAAAHTDKAGARRHVESPVVEDGRLWALPFPAQSAQNGAARARISAPLRSAPPRVRVDAACVRRGSTCRPHRPLPRRLAIRRSAAHSRAERSTSATASCVARRARAVSADYVATTSLSAPCRL
jgi:hypothetical protein